MPHSGKTETSLVSDYGLQAANMPLRGRLELLGNRPNFVYAMTRFPAKKTVSIATILEKVTDTDAAEIALLDYISHYLFLISELFQLPADKKLTAAQLKQLAKELIYSVDPITQKTWSDLFSLEDLVVFYNYARRGKFMGYTKERVKNSKGGYYVCYSENAVEIEFPKIYGRFDYSTFMSWFTLYLESRDATLYIYEVEPVINEQIELALKQGVEQRMLLELNEPAETDGETDYEALKRTMFAALDMGGAAGYNAMSRDIRIERNPQKRQILREWKAANVHLF